MKKFIIFGLGLFLIGCAGANTAQDTLPQAAQGFQVPEKEMQWQAEQERIGAIVRENMNWDTEPCVRCNFTDEEKEINVRIAQEIEAQQQAYEALLAEGVPEEKAVEQVYVKKEYTTPDKTKMKKPTRQMK